ncbi:MAG: hypothetical protein GX418_06900 [Clostridiales bacterium]|nr:hypothetical protein [Clostridiales bacterium]
MNRRWLAWMLSLMLLAGIGLPAQAADIATLDRALSRWTQGLSPVRFSAEMELKTLMPFTEDTIGRINGVLGHISVDATLTLTGEDSETALAIAMDGASLMEMTERLAAGAYTLQTTLLPNRTLTSAKESPMQTLTGKSGAEADEAATAAETAEETQTQNASDVTVAFSMLDGLTEMQAVYPALAASITEIAAEKRANYNIKGIGAGKWSRVARLTAEQCEALKPQLQAMLACGMDEVYRGEVQGMTFAKGFIAALYQNADKQDICLYLKGTAIYPDGSKRKLLWQWAFTNNGIRRKDNVKYEASRTSGTADTRTLAVTCTQESRSDEYSIEGSAVTSLKRGKITDAYTEKIDLSGDLSRSGALTLEGYTSGKQSRTASGETTDTTRLLTTDLLFTPGTDGARLSGTAVAQTLAGKTVQSEIAFTLAKASVTAAAPAAGVQADEGDAEVTINILGPEGDEAATEPSATDAAPDATTPETDNASASGNPPSSIEQMDDIFSDSGTQTDVEGSEYLVGTPPVGLTAYSVPQTETTVSMDGITEAQLQSLLAEAAQNLAGRLLLSVASLPAEDAALLRDGMTDEDYAAFLAMVGAL